MKNITKVINSTPFKNKTYECIAMGSKDEHPDLFYTPYSLTNWWFKNEPRSFGSINMIIHDICHIIDLYESGKEHQLLQPDFGWKLQDGDEKIPNAWMMNEMKIITMQAFLTSRIFGKSHDVNSNDIIRDYRKRTIDPFLPTKKEWKEVTKRLLTHHENIGVLKYLKLWKQATSYVKHNR